MRTAYRQAYQFLHNTKNRYVYSHEKQSRDLPHIILSGLCVSYTQAGGTQADTIDTAKYNSTIETTAMLTAGVILTLSASYNKQHGVY